MSRFKCQWDKIIIISAPHNNIDRKSKNHWKMLMIYEYEYSVNWLDNNE